MKRFFILTSLLTLPIHASTTFNTSIDFAKLQTNGIEYGISAIIGAQEPLFVHYLIVDPKKASIQLVAGQSCGDAEPTSTLAQGDNVLAAINGGFWDFQASNYYVDKMLRYLRMFGINKYDAYPVFAAKIDDQWHAISKEHTEVGPALNGVPMVRLGILGWNDEGDACIGHCATACTLSIGNKPYPVNDLNKPRSSGALLFTPAFKNKTPQRKGYVDIIIDAGNVIEKPSAGGSIVPLNGFIYSVSKKHASNISIGDAADLTMAFISPDIAADTLSNMTFLRGSTPVLLLDNEIVPALIETKSEFCTKRHPRTAVGLFSDGRWMFVVVDGRQGHSVGMTLIELAEFFQKFGCDSAINLDGGGSSTMIVDGTLVNSPSGDTFSLRRGPSMERPVSDAILIASRS